MIEFIKNRRSIRKFRNDNIPFELIREIIDAGRNAPSSLDSRPWEFVIVNEPETKNELARTKGKENEWMIGAPIMVVVCVDMNKSPSRWIDDGCAAAENILLASSVLGLGACWVPGYSTSRPSDAISIQKLLNLPSNIIPVVVIPVGYPDEIPQSKTLGDLNAVVHFESY